MAASSSTSARAHNDIARALAVLDTAHSHRRAAHRAIPNPKLKPLVLLVMPNAVVRRVGGSFECYVGDEHVCANSDACMHTTPDKAWRCLARLALQRDDALTGARQ